MTTEKTKPASTLRDGAFKAAIWRNTSEKGTFYSTEYTRTYHDGEQYRESKSYSGTDNLKLSRLAQKVYDRELELRAGDREAATQEAEAQEPTEPQP